MMPWYSSIGTDEMVATDGSDGVGGVGVVVVDDDEDDDDDDDGVIVVMEVVMVGEVVAVVLEVFAS